MTQIVGTNSVVADFNHVTLEWLANRFALERHGDEFWVAIEDLDEVAEARRNNTPPPPPARVQFRLVTGSHHMQVFWLPVPAGNAQVGFPFTWLIEDKRWVPRQDAFIRDPQAPPQTEVWNQVCIRCHTTASQPRPRPEEDVFDSRVAELGISCEACHGPAERHMKHQQALAKQPAAKKPAGPDTTIVQPRDLDHVRASHVCGFCHSMKWFDDREGWKENGFRFRPGDDLEQTTPIIRPKNLDAQPWLQRGLAKNPEILNDFFWPDGMIRVAGREFNGLIESPCYQRGQMSCLSCHSLHQSEPNDMLARGMEGNQACLQCHAKYRDETAALTAHTRHKADSPGSLCYNCHMPHTTYALLKSIRSHQIDSPTVRTTLQTGRPNACNLCHLDQTLDWTARTLTEWYGQPKAELNTEQTSTAASLLWLLKGDAGQRALAAWHLGWEPARRASDEHWQAPHLALLLDDPYSAVRYIAHKSLRQLPGFADFAFDFVGPSEARGRAKEQAFNRWIQQRSKPVEKNLAARLLKADGQPDQSAVARLLAERDDRPMRLRE